MLWSPGASRGSSRVSALGCSRRALGTWGSRPPGNGAAGLRRRKDASVEVSCFRKRLVSRGSGWRAAAHGRRVYPGAGTGAFVAGLTGCPVTPVHLRMGTGQRSVEPAPGGSVVGPAEPPRGLRRVDRSGPMVGRWSGIRMPARSLLLRRLGACPHVPASPVPHSRPRAARFPAGHPDAEVPAR